jgi:hypothetical protein
MTLVNIPNIEENDEATPELWNSRFATLADVINGNIDGTNLADGAVSNSKLASEAVTSNKLGLQSVTPDRVANPVAFRAEGTSKSIAAATWTKLVADTEIYDYANAYDNATNYRFTATVAGIYNFSSNGTFSASERIIIEIRVNGVDSGMYRGNDFTVTTASAAKTTSVSVPVELAVGDYVEAWVWSDDAGTVSGFFAGHLIGQVQDL